MGLVWRTRRTRDGRELGSEWTDVADDESRVIRRPLVGRVFPRQSWEATPGMELAPTCHVCGSPLVWRNTWQCQGCSVRGGWSEDSLQTPRALPREALAGTRIFSASEGNNSTEGRARQLWAVEALTSFHRRSRAAHYRLGGRRPDVTWIDWETGELTPARIKTGRWHEQRIAGQADRFERVALCGTFVYALDVTDAAGRVTTRPIAYRCDCWRVCPRCARRRRWKLTEGMKVQRELALRRYARESRAGYRGKEGKWSEKLITFTVPHGPDGPAADARMLVGAWQKLLRKVRTHLADRGALRTLPSGKRAPAAVPWCRTLEVAMRNGEHAHMHVWWHGPFIDSVLLQLWWGAILEAEGAVGLQTVRWADLAGKGHDSRLFRWLGCPRADAVLPRGIADIRADKTGDAAIAEYTQKVGVAFYVTKGSETLYLEPAHAASIYEVFEGTRAVQWASGWAPPKVPLQAKCVTFRRLTEEEKKACNQRHASYGNHSTDTQKPAENEPKNEVQVETLADPPQVLQPLQLRLPM
jgi:hypothetical protein